MERDWLTRQEAAAFVGSNADFYLETWKQHADTTFKGWNWAAMFFGLEWMVYRKLYGEALALFFLGFCISGVAGFFLPDLLGELAGYGFRAVIGALGNMLYRKKALRVLRRMGSQNDAERLAELARRGGVSLGSILVMLLLELALGFLLVCLE